MASYFIGIDVGTGSARAGVFDLNGRMVGQASRAIEIYRPQADFVEQSSDNIWQAVCNAVRDAINQSDINPIQVKGLGFDATCSLVVPVSYTHLTLPTIHGSCRSRWSPDH